MSTPDSSSSETSALSTNEAEKDRTIQSKVSKESDGDSHSLRSKTRGKDLAALGVRIPRVLDNKLAGLLYKLKLQNIRISKAELVALALEDLPDEPTPLLIERLEKR